ncbi:MAG: hypothetical protein JWQ38_1379 [Flavipsychrobacter sp.]|nr:hypothetical protein [Flavipsychrobacter sp.]
MTYFEKTAARTIVALLLAFIFSTTGHSQAKGYCASGDCENGFGVLVDTSSDAWIQVHVGTFRKKRFEDTVTTYDLSKIYNFEAMRRSYHKSNRKVINMLLSNPDNESVYSYDQDPYNKSIHLRCGWLDYNGAVKNKYPEGKGTLTYDIDRRRYDFDGKKPTIDRFVGNFKQGNPDGFGRLYYTNGKSDSVEFSDGIIVWPVTPDESAFKEGCISGDCKNGWGTYVWTHNQLYKYEGLWKDGIPATFGTLFYINGEMYIGQFSNAGTYNGWGIHYSYPGISETGFFVNGVYKEELSYTSSIDHSKGRTWDAFEKYQREQIYEAVGHADHNAVTEVKQWSGDKCNACKGTGKVKSDFPCRWCKGSGHRKSTTYRASDQTVKTDFHSDGSSTRYYIPQGVSSTVYDCDRCHGSGKDPIKCQKCYGKGVIP